ncbi:hypothetical protein, partial [Pseudomonas aeruginosa]
HICILVFQLYNLTREQE